MRWLYSGFLILILPAAALAQASGQVLTIGFQNCFRPDCWTPMLIQLTSETNESNVFQIQIVQEDLDRDRVSFTQQVTLSGNTEGQPVATENFWVYFRPQITDGGLPDPSYGLADLQRKLKVFLCNKNGKQLKVLPITSTVQIIDPRRSENSTSRGQKLVLFVNDGVDSPAVNVDYSKYVGVTEDMVAVSVHTTDLPNNVVGYEAVDAIVWLNADANILTRGTRGSSLDALQTWVRQGGHLVVCQPPESFKIKPFASILPVGPGGVESATDWTLPVVDRPGNDLGPLERLTELGSYGRHLSASFDKIKSVKMGRTNALPDAKVDEWIEWTDTPPASTWTPWLARRGVGMGMVTWVAVDLGNPAITNNVHEGWRYVWDRVLDWNNPPVPEIYKPLDRDDPWDNYGGASVELGASLIKGMDLTNKAAYLIGLAIVFFIAYWAIAGPGVFFILRSRGKSHLSWFYFGASALAATGLTVALVKLVVRGPPELRHISVVRYAAGEPYGVINSRFGLYIPQDGPKTVELKDAAPDEVSYLTPFSLHPQFVADSDSFPSYLDYDIPVRDAGDTDPVAADIPYRSTLKKLQALWVGEIKNKIELAPGTSAITVVSRQKGYLNGSLINHTGGDLADVYMAFQNPTSINEGSVMSEDRLLYIREWKKDEILDLGTLMNDHTVMNLLATPSYQPESAKVIYGSLNFNAGDSWPSYWASHDKGLADDLSQAYPILALFDRIPPWRNGKSPDTKCMNLMRRGARQLNLSAAESSGKLVIFALSLSPSTADSAGQNNTNPLPFTLTVSDSKVEGDNNQGTVMLEFALPLDRSGVANLPATRPVARAGNAARNPVRRVVALVPAGIPGGARRFQVIAGNPARPLSMI